MIGIAAPPGLPLVPFGHLARLTDGTGLFEHAEILQPRTAHGYCVDDVARALVVAARQAQPSNEVRRLAGIYRTFVFDAQDRDGRFHNRRGVDGAWEDEPSLEDCWGRALWALGTAFGRTPAPAHDAPAHDAPDHDAPDHEALDHEAPAYDAPAREALARFDLGAGHRSPHLRAMAFAALGAAEILRVRPAHRSAQALLADAATAIEAGGPPTGSAADHRWNWPEPRLRYANAVLPETLIAAGSLLGDARRLDDGLAMLAWLLDAETAGGHLSVTPVGGWSPGEPRPGFDQQPIEVAALADACARAFDITGVRRWQDGVARAAAWFLGDNDVHTALYDDVSGGGCDGLMPDGRNENQGAESTLAMISTFQQAHRVCPPAR